MIVEERAVRERALARREMRAHATRTAAFLILIAVALLAAVRAWQMGFWRLGGPGPGLWPFVVACVMLLAVAGAYGQERRHEPEELPQTSVKRELIAFGSILVFVVAFSYIGMPIPTFLLLLLWLTILAGESWRLAVPLAFLGTVGLYVVFDALLGVPVPASIFDRMAF